MPPGHAPGGSDDPTAGRKWAGPVIGSDGIDTAGGMNTGFRGWLAVGLALALGAPGGCAARSAQPSTPTEPPLPAYPPALAATVEQLLPSCHAGKLEDCRALGMSLLEADYWQQAAATFGYGCYLPSEVGHHAECKQYLDGSCAPDACACAGQPGCAAEPWMCEPAMRDYRCGDRTHARCIARQRLEVCRSGSLRLQYWALRRDNDTDAVCSDRSLRVQVESVALAEYACKDLGSDGELAERFRKLGNHDGVCDRYDAATMEKRECDDYRADMARFEAERAASRAQFQQQLSQQLAHGLGDIAGTAQQVQAANRGEIRQHQRVELPLPGALPTSGPDLGAALVARAPELLQRVAALHPKGARLFEASAVALTVIRASERPPAPPPAAEPSAPPAPPADPSEPPAAAP